MTTVHHCAKWLSIRNECCNKFSKWTGLGLEGLVLTPTQKLNAWYTPAQMFGMKMWSNFCTQLFFVQTHVEKKKMANGLNENTNLPLTVGGAYGKTKIPRFIHCFQAK